MSFTGNPYRHMDVVVDKDGTVSVDCHGCGAVLRSEELTLDVPLRAARSIMDDHIVRNHQRAPSDFEGWD